MMPVHAAVMMFALSSLPHDINAGGRGANIQPALNICFPIFYNPFCLRGVIKVYMFFYIMFFEYSKILLLVKGITNVCG